MKRGYELILLGGGVGALIGLFTGLSEKHVHDARAPSPFLFAGGAALAGAGIGTLGFGLKQKMHGVSLGGAAAAVVGGLVMRHYYKRYAELQSPVVITEDGSVLDQTTGASVPVEALPSVAGLGAFDPYQGQLQLVRA
jgi:hypothetical protein